MALTKIDDRGLKTPIDLLDNEKIRLGTGNDLELSHSGTNSNVLHTGSGNLNIQTTSGNITLVASNESMIKCLPNNSVELYFDNSMKLRTYSAGTEVIGNLWLQTGGVYLKDSVKLNLGNSVDAELFHNGNNLYLDNKTGGMYIRPVANLFIQNYNTGEVYIRGNANAAVELYHNGVKKLETTSTGATVTGDLEVTGCITSTSRTNRNLIINGAMQVAQRGTSFADPASGTYTLDRFLIQNSSGTPAFTVTQDTDAPHGFNNSLKVACTTADASPAAGSFSRIRYSVEAQDLQSLAKGTSSAKAQTLSFYVKTNKTGVYTVFIFDDDNTRMMSASYTVSDTNWNRYTISIPADTTGAMADDNGAGYVIHWGLSLGSNRLSGSLASTWAAYSQANEHVGNVNFADNTSNVWAITGVQLEVGSVATDFEHLPYCDVMRKCMRYYYQTKGDGTLGGVNNYASGIFGFGLNGNIVGGGFRFPEPMRAAPSLTLIRPSDGATNGLHLFRGVTGSHGGTDKTSSIVNFTDVGRYSYMYIGLSANVVDQGGGYLYHIIASAEL